MYIGKKQVFLYMIFSTIMALLIVMAGCARQPETPRPQNFKAASHILSAEEGHKNTKDIDKIYQILSDKAKEEGRSYGLETAAHMVASLGMSGYVAVDSDNQVDMTCIEKVLEFCGIVDRGENGKLTIIVVDSWEAFITYDMESIGGNVNITKANHRLDQNGDFQMVGSISYPASFWHYTEEGYLIFEGSYCSEEYVLTLSDTAEHTAIRVLPLDKICREFNRKYILPIGYGWNNMFLCNWNEKDYGSLDFYDLFDLFYLKLYGYTVPYTVEKEDKTESIFLIPEDIFESVIMTYLYIDPKSLRSKTTYFPEKSSYEYRPRGVYETQYPEIPYPEVVDYQENHDGTITLLVNAVYPCDNTSRSYSHRTIVRPLDDGHIQYISNEMIPPEEIPDTWWRRERLTREEWMGQYP